MGSELSEIPTAALRELGRVWSRIIWLILFASAVLADVLAALYPSVYPWNFPWSGFLLGLSSGITFSGLAITLIGRHPPSPREAAITR